MYGFRKPYTSAGFESIRYWGLSFKSILVIAQSIGYLCSKWIGIRFVSTVLPQKRAQTILFLLFAAWLTLFCFAVVPVPYNFIFMFLNGLPLGMIWGLVFSYLEGRTFTDLMGAILATSFIFASGFAKFVGKTITVSFHVTDLWMPFWAASLFMIPALLSVILLNQSPQPLKEEQIQKTLRRPMNSNERKIFISQFYKILIPLCIGYLLLTIVRDFCEDFANELWVETGFGNNASLFAQTGTIISVLVLFLLAGFFIIKNNYKAYILNQRMVIVGFALCIISSLLFQMGILNVYQWFLMASSGMYLGFVSYNCILFERMMAAFEIEGTVGFVIYIADTFGYLGALLILICKGFIQLKISWAHFFIVLFFVAGILGIIVMLLSIKESSSYYKNKKHAFS